MMKSRGNLNQTLEKHLFRVGSLQPNFFPMFMRIVKMRGIECFKPLLEKLGLFA